MTEIAKKLFATAYTKEINKEERTIVAWASKAIIDRDKEIIKGNAWDLKAYRKHPIIILSHNYRELTNSWVGKTLWIKPSEEGLLFKAQFATTGAAKEAYQLVEDTGIAAFSVGFIPKKWEDKMIKDMTEEEKEMVKGSGLGDGDKVRIYTKCELLEISLVSVPSCSTAVLAAYNEGKIKTKELKDKIKETMEIEIIDEDKEKDTITKPEETEDYIRIPVRECKITATIDISGKEGIKALYCGKIKKIATYLFAKAKGWDMKKAQAWVKEHGKEYDDIDIKDFEVEEDTETHEPEGKNEQDDQEKQEEPNKNFSLDEIYEIIKENKELTVANILLNKLNEQLELKAGAVLNKKNKTDLTNAQKLIQNVLDSAETSEEGKETFNCECISCGYKMTSDKHCDTLKCPKCGGEMRRAERPGPGKELLEFDFEAEDKGININVDEIKGIIDNAIKEKMGDVTEKLKENIDDNFKKMTGRVI